LPRTHGTAVDVHSHLYVPSYVEYLRARREPPYVRTVDGADRFMLFPGDQGVPMGDEFTSVVAKLAYMDRSGIAHSVISLGNPWLDLTSGPETVELAAVINQELASAVTQGAGRLSAFGVLPNHDVESAISTVKALSEEGTAVGLVASTSICGHQLDDPALRPLWGAIEVAGLPVLVHPQAGLAGAHMRGYGQALTLAISFPFETTTALARMLLAGVFEAHPSLRIIGAHGAGSVPYLYGRLWRAVSVDGVAGSLPAKPPTGLFADSILFSATSLKQCIDVIGSENVMFGTDHPFPIADAKAGIADVLEATSGDDHACASILSDNARRLFHLEAVSDGYDQHRHTSAVTSHMATKGNSDVSGV
jgi:aminocarboxymuconate-semialdehyde decarboxylase